MVLQCSRVGCPPLRSFVEVPAPSVTVCEHRAIKLIKATYIHNSAALIQDPLPSEGASGGSCTQLALGGGGLHTEVRRCAGLRPTVPAPSPWPSRLQNSW